MISSLSGPDLTGVGAASKTSTSQANGQLASKEAFLQLLVSQIKNQNPLNPTDGVQFLTQLAQFSELEQLISMGSDMKQIRETLDGALLAPETEPAG